MIIKDSCFIFFISAHSDMGWGLGHYRTSLGETLYVWTQHLPQNCPPHAPDLLLCRREHMGRLPTIILWCDESDKALGGWKTALWLQQQRLYKDLWPLHTGVCTFELFFLLMYCANVLCSPCFPVCVKIVLSLKKKKGKLRSKLHNLTLSLSPGCVGKQLQGWLCRPAVPEWCQ